MARPLYGVAQQVKRGCTATLSADSAIRDAIEHPKGSNTYNPASGQWDQVPLARFLSERGLAAFGGCSQFVKSIADDWQQRAKEVDAPAELYVERGAYSQRQFKKPLSGPAGPIGAG